MKVGPTIERALPTPTVADHLADLADRDDCRLALDLGCGTRSALAAHRPKLHTVGLDAFQEVLDEARALGVHDDYVLADVLAFEVDEILEKTGGRRFDLVYMSHVIEHLPKHEGHALLRRCEELTDKFIVIETPNGFVEQGPEYGNPYQRHLSGWFPHEFEGYAYSVYGSFGTRHIRDYGGYPRRQIPGWYTADVLLSALLRIRSHPRHAFNLVAVKDVRGVPARLGPVESLGATRMPAALAGSTQLTRSDRARAVVEGVRARLWLLVLGPIVGLGIVAGASLTSDGMDYAARAELQFDSTPLPPALTGLGIRAAPVPGARELLSDQVLRPFARRFARSPARSIPLAAVGGRFRAHRRHDRRPGRAGPPHPPAGR